VQDREAEGFEDAIKNVQELFNEYPDECETFEQFLPKVIKAEKEGGEGTHTHARTHTHAHTHIPLICSFPHRKSIRCHQTLGAPFRSKQDNN
jgi:histone deacetylase complex regulatory component SIN3